MNPEATSAVVTADGPGKTSTGTPASRAASTKHAARIADARHARIRAKRHFLTVKHAGDESRRLSGDDVLVTALEPVLDAEVRQQFAGHARVLGADDIGLLERLERTAVISPRLPSGVGTMISFPVIIIV